VCVLITIIVLELICDLKKQIILKVNDNWMFMLLTGCRVSLKFCWWPDDSFSLKHTNTMSCREFAPKKNNQSQKI